MVSHGSESAFVFWGTWKTLKPTVDFGKTASSCFEGKTIYTHHFWSENSQDENSEGTTKDFLVLESLHSRSRNSSSGGTVLLKCHLSPEDSTGCIHSSWLFLYRAQKVPLFLTLDTPPQEQLVIFSMMTKTGVIDSQVS